MRKGRIHIYCGNGKGKTTAAIGLAVRSCGSGYQVIFTQFLKSGTTGELNILNGITGISVIRAEKPQKFTFQMNEDEKKEAEAINNTLFSQAISRINDGKKTLLILDEVLDAMSKNLIDQAVVHEFLKERQDIEIVMTGRDPDDLLLNLADYVSEIKKVKHPYDHGVPARKGIEY